MDPDRAERTWLALAPATIWSLSMGTSANEIEKFDEAWRNEEAFSLKVSERFPLYGAFQYDFSSIRAIMFKGECIRMGEFYPYPWESTPSEDAAQEKKRYK